MPYCTRANIEDRYGTTNVFVWSDLDSDNNATKIANRITRAIAVADAYIDDTLRNSDINFQLPLTSTTLTDVAVKLAGYWLSTARGVRDYDDKGKPITRLTGDRDEALETLRMIATGQLKPSTVV